MRNLGSSTRLDTLIINDALRRVLTDLQFRHGVLTIGNLYRFGPYEFTMIDGVEPTVFQGAAELLVHHGLCWQPDDRLYSPYATVLRDIQAHQLFQ